MTMTETKQASVLETAIAASAILAELPQHQRAVLQAHISNLLDRAIFVQQALEAHHNRTLRRDLDDAKEQLALANMTLKLAETEVTAIQSLAMLSIL